MALANASRARTKSNGCGWKPELRRDATRSNRAIAELVGVDHVFVSKIRAELETGDDNQLRIHHYEFKDCRPSRADICRCRAQAACRNCEDLRRGCEGFVKNVAHSALNQHRRSMTLRRGVPEVGVGGDVRVWVRREPVPPVRG